MTLFDAKKKEPLLQRMRRNKLGIGLGISASLLSSYVAYKSLFPETLAVNMEQIYLAENSAAMSGAAKKAVSKMEKEDMREIAFGDGKLIQPRAIESANVTIVRADSPLVAPYASAMAVDEALVGNEIQYIIFSPYVKGEREDVNGLSVGDGIIMIDTEADDSGKKNPKTFASVMGHEGEHEGNRKYALPLLEDEKRSSKREAHVLRNQMKTDKDPILQATYYDVQKRIDTAEFLEGLGSDFDGVYPGAVILAKDVLTAKIPVQKVESYKQLAAGRPDLYGELYQALNMAEIALKNPRDDAIKALYAIATDSRYANTSLQVNAASALQYLTPDVLSVSSTADVVSGSDRTAFVSFNKHKSSGIGKGAVSSGSFGVEGLPSLGDLLSRDKPVKGTFTTIELYDGDVVKSEHGFFSGDVIYIPRREGRPGKGFYRSYMKAEDSDRNGKDDTLIVGYASNNIKGVDGMPLKVDIYKDKKFVRSGLLKFDAAGVENSDLDFDIDKVWKKWNIETYKN